MVDGIAAPPVHQYGIDLQQPWQLVSIHLENKNKNLQQLQSMQP